MLVVNAQIPPTDNMRYDNMQYPGRSYAHSPECTGQACRDKMAPKKSLSIQNVGTYGLYLILAREDMSQLKNLSIHQNGLNSAKFLEGLRLPSLRILKITGGRDINCAASGRKTKGNNSYNLI